MKKYKNIVSFLKPYIRHHKLEFFFVMILSVILSIIQSLPAKLTQLIFDKGFANKNLRYIIISALLLLVLQLSRTILSFFIGKKYMILGQKILKKIRSEIYRKILKLPMDFYTENESTYVTVRTKEINNASEIFSPSSFGIITSILDFIFISVILLDLSWKIYLVLLIPVPLLFLIVKQGSAKLKKQSEEVLEKGSRQTTMLNERIKGLEFIQTNSKEDQELSKINKIDEDVVETKIKQSLLMKTISESIGIFTFIAPVLLYIFGGIFFMNNGITIGGILVFSMYMGRIYSPFLTISTLSLTIEPALVAIERINKMFFSETKDLQEIKGQLEFDEKIETVAFKNVSFSYDDNRELLNDLCFKVKSDTVFNINGVNGSGKTTVLKLCIGLLEPDKGVIEFNGKDISKYKSESIRKRLAVVSQKTFLFNDTIKNNIIYTVNSPNDEHIKERYDIIAELIGIEKIYENHNANRDMNIGENGVKLSGGEIQKIAIARALIKDADLIIFDEASVNIDKETNKVIKKIITEQLKRKIIIIVDHSGYFDDISDKILYL